MSETPAPLPIYNAAGRRNRGFRHQVLGYPMTPEWLTKRSMELFGKKNNFFGAAAKTVADFKHNRTVHAVYDRKTKEYALVVALAENVTPGTLREPPEEECEWFRQYLGVEGKPLWYNVSN
ncbi:hypothetical protein SCHPADRAFT_995395 [Schizopora paradoxa]|uniref:Uncharacterized protein n=1 Tax=Schizopora paradoxa TaxID=27342 RepID=A0A0H2RVG8_9AGAM|nr:hypothetical protein SCHPADRAFT_995395 [Schizopora paradoxa]